VDVDGAITKEATKASRGRDVKVKVAGRGRLVQGVEGLLVERLTKPGTGW